MSWTDELHSWIAACESKGVIAILTHRNGDMDTIASGCALAEALGSSTRCVGIHVSKVAREVIQKLNFHHHRMDSNRPAWPRTIAGIIVVDAGGPGQIGIELPANIPLCVLDHHANSYNSWVVGYTGLHINRPVKSTTQIIHEYLRDKLPNTLTERIRKLLMTGLISDTGHYRHADSIALSDAALILGSDIQHGEVLDLLRTTGLGRSTRTATLRALSRVKVEISGGWTVGITSCGTHEGLVGSSLINAGADVAIVTNTKNPLLRVTTRASHRAVEGGIAMGDILSSLAELHGSEGGGHPGAAGWTTEIDSVEAVSSILSRISAIGGGEN
ncbi:MAG: DHH family phosphoesterase [Candidatus Thermoplasmatota archaeon]|nr:DHH family phosphoesterase [Candidatus Thermoplasmatota archaeon]